jgi:hypothetical protein
VRAVYILLMTILAASVTAYAQDIVGPKKVIVITDMEPDDRLALQVLAAKYKPEDVAFVGSAVLDSRRKAILVRRLLDQIGLASVPVYQGQGGEASKYYPMASSAAAVTYEGEGKGILSDNDLKVRSSSRLNFSGGDLSLTMQMGDYLRANYRAGNKHNIDIILLAPTDDLLEVLTNGLGPAISGIGTVHMMGGWSEAKDPDTGELDRRTTYNWNMGYESARVFFQYMRSGVYTFNVKLYSSHMIKPTFGGGSINESNHPALIKALDEASKHAPSLQDFRKAGLGWDNHLVTKIPPLAKVIGPYVGNQFTPADPLVVIGAADPNFVKVSRRVDLTIDTGNLDDKKGFAVQIKDSNRSHVELVEQIDVGLFESEMIKTFDHAVSCARLLENKSSSH